MTSVLFTIGSFSCWRVKCLFPVKGTRVFERQSFIRGVFLWTIVFMIYAIKRKEIAFASVQFYFQSIPDSGSRALKSTFTISIALLEATYMNELAVISLSYFINFESISNLF